MRRQHNGSLFSGRNSHHSYIPSLVSEGVGDVTDYFTWETLVTIWISNTESDGIERMCYDSEVSPLKRIC